MNMSIEISNQKENKALGIGILASKAGNTQVGWALREGSTGEILLDYAQAVKLALSKALQGS